MSTINLSEMWTARSWSTGLNFVAGMENNWTRLTKIAAVFSYLQISWLACNYQEAFLTVT